MASAIEPGKSYGFFTDTSICIGCKACEVACKEWNELQGNEPKFLADSYDNTGQLDDQNWRHVKFIDDVPAQSADAGNGKACPTQSIQFGLLGDLHTAADNRLATLHSQGVTQAQLYGRDDAVYGGLNAFFLLMDKPETYGLPNADNAQLPTRNDAGGYLAALVTGILGVIAGIVAFRRRGAS